MEERGVHPGIAEDQGGFVDDLRFCHQRRDDVLGGVDETEQVDVRAPSGSFERGGQHLGLRVACAGTQTPQRPVDVGGAVLRSGQRIRDPDAEVVVGVEADVCVDRASQGGDPCTGLLRHHRAGGVDHVDYVGAIGIQLGGLLGQRLGLEFVAHHQKAHDGEALALRPLDWLLGAVGFGAVHRNPHGADAGVDGALKFGEGGDAGHVQGGDVGVFDGADRGADVFGVGGCGLAILDGRRAQSDAVRHLDGRHTGPVESGGDGGDVVGGELVRHAGHAVTQRCVDQGHRLGRIDVGGHCAAPVTRFCWAITSATRVAAAVMMSRLPA